MESVQLNSDSTYTLECIISGEPEPKVIWYKDNIEIGMLPEPLLSTYKTSKFMNVRQLIILKTEPELHSGTYTCRAKNEYGEADCSCGILVRSKIQYFNIYFLNALTSVYIKINVSKEPVIKSAPSERAPVIDEPLVATYIVKEGKPISLLCRYTATSRVEVIWLKDNQPIDLNLMGLLKDFKARGC